MSRFMAVLGGAVVLMACFASTSASASTWSTANAGAFAATAPSAVITIRGTSLTVMIRCSAVAATGTFSSLTNATAPVSFATVTPTFSGCRSAGVPFGVSCSSGSMSVLATSTYSGGATYVSPSWAADGGASSGLQIAISCTTRVGTTNCSTISGTARGNLVNPVNHAATTRAGVLTVPIAGQSLTAVGTGCAGVIPQGSVTIAADTTPQTDLPYTYTSPALGSQPVLWAS